MIEICYDRHSYMKVILLRDVAKLGKKSSIVEVPSGHALNFLIPRKMALPATPDNVKRHAEETKKHTERHIKDREHFLFAIQELAVKHLALSVETNEKGHLYKGVGADDIFNLLQEAGYHIEKRAIILPHSIKSVGTYDVPLVFGSDKGVLHLEIVKK